MITTKRKKKEQKLPSIMLIKSFFVVLMVSVLGLFLGSSVFIFIMNFFIFLGLGIILILLIFALLTGKIK